MPRKFFLRRRRRSVSLELSLLYDPPRDSDDRVQKLRLQFSNLSDNLPFSGERAAPAGQGRKVTTCTNFPKVDLKTRVCSVKGEVCQI